MPGSEVEGGGESQRARTSPTSSSGRLRVRTDPFLVVCRCFSVITALTAVLCIVVNVLSAIRSFKDGSDIFNGIFRCYAVLIAVFVAVAETEWGFITKFWKFIVCRYWSIGLAGVCCRSSLVLLQNIASYMLLACGVIYVISGILCIGCLKRARQQKEISRDQAIKDLEELERRREELEYMLLDDQRA